MSGLVDVGRALTASFIADAVVKPAGRLVRDLSLRASESAFQRFQRRVREQGVEVQIALEQLAGLPAPACELAEAKVLRRLGYARRRDERDLPTVLGVSVLADARYRGARV